MKMFIKMIAIALIALLITGCTPNVPATAGNNPLATNADPTSTSSNPAPTNNDPIPTDTAPANLKFSTVHGEWIGYSTVEKLMQNATNVFEGKLKEISFRVVNFQDVKSGKVYSYLYTFYDFEVSSSYKGENAEIVRMGIYGGMEGYKEAEQYNAMVHGGIYNEKSGIPVLDGYTHPTIGESYLIVGIDLGNDFIDIANPTQSIYSANRSGDNTKFTYQEIKDYLSKS